MSDVTPIPGPDQILALNSNKFLDLDNNFIDSNLGELKEDLTIKIIYKFVLDLSSTMDYEPFIYFVLGVP